MGTTANRCEADCLTGVRLPLSPLWSRRLLALVAPGCDPGAASCGLRVQFPSITPRHPLCLVASFGRLTPWIIVAGYREATYNQEAMDGA